jgi:hypothetical protein
MKEKPKAATYGDAFLARLCRRRRIGRLPIHFGFFGARAIETSLRRPSWKLWPYVGLDDWMIVERGHFGGCTMDSRLRQSEKTAIQPIRELGSNQPITCCEYPRKELPTLRLSIQLLYSNSTIGNWKCRFLTSSHQNTY